MLKYTVTSFSEGKKGGQITVTVGEGRNRRSFTRHLHHQGGALIGLNIDGRAIPLNERYEAEFAEAQAEMASTEAELKKLMKERDEKTTDPTVTDEDKAVLEATIAIATVKVLDATEVLDDAETKLDIVRRELPLMMEFRRN